MIRFKQAFSAIWLLFASLLISLPAFSQTGISSFIQPFPLLYAYHDFHVMLYMSVHPAYESVEAMICEKEGATPSIRAILTRHDNTQIDYVNRSDVVESVREKNIDREIF